MTQELFDAYADHEDQREDDFPSVALQTALCWRRLQALLSNGPLRILDAGAGTGRYSLPLARLGHSVVHLDIAPMALERVREQAQDLDLTLVQQSILDLGAFADQSFDLVLCFDAPLSFVHPEHERALSELCRVCRGHLAILTSARHGMVRDALIWDLERRYLPENEDEGDLDPFVYARALLSAGRFDWPDSWREHLDQAGLLSLPDYGFTPEELESGLRQRGLTITESRAIGALAANLSDEALGWILGEPKRREAFVRLEEDFAESASVRGMGGPNLLVIAKRES